MTIKLFTETRGLGPNLVMLHGWGLNSGVWEPISHELQKHFRVTYIDLPGFGRNADCMPYKYDLAAISNLVSECLPMQCHLLGWSLGGLVAQYLACQSNARISSIILLTSSPKFAESENWPGIKQDVLQLFEQQLERDFSKTLERFLAIQAMGSQSARGDIKLIREHVQQYPMPAQKALQAGLTMLAKTDLRNELSSILVPIHRLYGRLDSLVPLKAMHQIEAISPSTTQHVFAKASHAPFISHPEEFINQLKTMNLKA